MPSTPIHLLINLGALGLLALGRGAVHWPGQQGAAAFALAHAAGMLLITPDNLDPAAPSKLPP